MLKFYSFAACFLLLSLITSAQSNFKPGYVVTTKNETLNGLIDYRGWPRNPKEVSFKTGINQPVKKITTTNANGFGINGLAYYMKAGVKITNSNNEIASAIDSTFTTDTVFLKTIVKGRTVSLYLYNDGAKAHFYAVEEQYDKMIPLNKYLYADKQHATVSVNRYADELLKLAMVYQPQNADLQANIKTANYNAGDLSTIVKKLNGDFGVQQAVKGAFGTRLFVSASFRSSKLDFVGANSPFVKGVNGSSSAPEIAVGIDLIPNRNTESIFVRIQAAYTQDHFDVADPQSGAVALHSLDFKHTAISLVPQIFYNVYHAEKLKVFVNAGVSISHYSYNKYYYVSKFSNGNETRQENYPAFEKTRLSVPVGAGVQVGKHIQVAVGYTPPRGIELIRNWDIHQSTWQGGITYLFN